MGMKFNDRLKASREHAGLTQAQLAEATGIAQPTISYLENATKNATGSEFTARFARACGVSVDWLSDEIGEMHPDLYQTTDKKLIAMCRAMEDRAEYVKDAAVTAVLTTRELAERAKENGGNSGTHG